MLDKEVGVETKELSYKSLARQRFRGRFSLLLLLRFGHTLSSVRLLCRRPRSCYDPLTGLFPVGQELCQALVG